MKACCSKLEELRVSIEDNRDLACTKAGADILEDEAVRFPATV